MFSTNHQFLSIDLNAAESLATSHKSKIVKGLSYIMQKHRLEVSE